MISSIVLKKDRTNIDFTKIEVDLLSGKMAIYDASYELEEELLVHIEAKHRIYLPCKIKVDSDLDNAPLIATVCVPIFWDGDAIENYTQALLDEIYLFKHQLPGHKTLQQIEQSFMLEMIVL